MAASANTFTTLQPIFKEVYSDGKGGGYKEGKKATRGLNYKKYGFKKLKQKLRDKDGK